MYTTIRQVVLALRKKRQDRSGFTLPELLLSLCICILVLQIVWQWAVLQERAEERQQQNRQAVWLAQSAFANALSGDIPSGWDVQVEQAPCGFLLQEKLVTVSFENQSWSFYYAGKGLESK